jgi:hypothetical protein
MTDASRPDSDSPPSTRPDLGAAPQSDHSKTKWAVWLPIIIAISVLAGGAVSWGYGQYTTGQKERTDSINAQRVESDRLLKSSLLPTQVKLSLRRSILEQINKHYLVPGYGILESYVLLAKQGSVKPLALPFGLITELVKTDAEIVTLLEGYDASHVTAEFKKESDNFLEHARTYIIRFKALPDIISSGADLPQWKTFPEKFPSALEGEIAARRAETNRDGRSEGSSQYSTLASNTENVLQ